MSEVERSHAVQDYLRAIYDLTAVQTHARATTNQLAERLAVRPSSVTGMLQKMAEADPPLIQYEKHRGVQLTERGRRIALEITRHHRLLEAFLHDVLGFRWDEVHEEADRLEHVISEELEERIDLLLGRPGRDPHGDPIPDRQLRLPPPTAVALEDLRPGQAATVQRIRDDNAALLIYLGELGIVPEAELTVLERLPFERHIRLQVTGREAVIIAPQISEQIFVRPAASPAGSGSGREEQTYLREQTT